MRMSEGLHGSINTELMPGCSPPATPNHCRRSGICHNASFSDQDSPPSSVRKSPPGSVPAQTRPGTPPGSSAQILPSDQGRGSSPASSGLGGKPAPGTHASFRWGRGATVWLRNGRDPTRHRRCRRYRAARQRQDRREIVRLLCPTRPLWRASSNKPLWVPIWGRSVIPSSHYPPTAPEKRRSRHLP